MTRPFLTTLAMLLTAFGPAMAQTTPAVPSTTVQSTSVQSTTVRPTTVPPPTGSPLAGSVPLAHDLGALDFYVQQKDQASVNAELRRTWRIAAVFEAQQDVDTALATYFGILNSCTNFPTS